jgi:hypothetical protein
LGVTATAAERTAFIKGSERSGTDVRGATNAPRSLPDSQGVVAPQVVKQHGNYDQEQPPLVINKSSARRFLEADAGLLTVGGVARGLLF